MSDETPDQMLVRVCRTVEEQTNLLNAMSQSISDLMNRTNVLDGHVTNLLAQEGRTRGVSAAANGVPVPPFPDGLGPDSDPNPLLRSTVESGWKAIRFGKVYLTTVPEYDGRASNWGNFITKLRLILDQAYEWAPLYLRMSERLESAPTREGLTTWIEQPEIRFDRSDMVEFGKDLWVILSNRTAAGTGPASVVHRVMETESGWLRGPVALYELQREALGRAADRRAELNRRVHNPVAVNRWEDVAGAINRWETVMNEYNTLTGHKLEDETRMNSLMRLLPKSLYELTVSQYGISSYAQLRSYVLAQCTRAKYGQHGLSKEGKEKKDGPVPMELGWFPEEDDGSLEAEAYELDGAGEDEDVHHCEDEWCHDHSLLAMKGKGKKGKGKGKGKGKEKGKWSEKVSDDKSSWSCWWCGKTGHQMVDCYELQNLKGKHGKAGGKSKNWTPGKGYSAPEWSSQGYDASAGWVQPVTTDVGGVSLFALPCSESLGVLTCDGDAQPLLQVRSDDGWECLESMIDSGAARSVCPVHMCADLGTSPAVNGPDHFLTATGARVANHGLRQVRGCADEGIDLTMTYNVAEISTPLDSVSQICDKGNIVVFTADGGFICGPRGRLAFRRKNDTYVRHTWVRKSKAKGVLGQKSAPMEVDFLRQDFP